MTKTQGPEPIIVERGQLMTLKAAAEKTGRHLKLLQRWHAQGLLPSRFEQAAGHHAILITEADIEKVASMRKIGVRRPRERRFKTVNGIPVRLRAKPQRKAQKPTPKP